MLPPKKPAVFSSRLLRPGLLLWLALAPWAPAAIVVTITEHRDGIGAPAVNPGVALPVSSTDLVNAGQPTLDSVASSGFTPYTSGTTSSPNVLNDGLNGGWNVTAGNTAVTTQSTPWTLTYSLSLAGASFGYDLTGIDVMSLWTNDFVNQRYSVEISTISVPAFTLLTSPVVAQTATSGGSAGSSLLSSIRENDTGILASGVTAIRFTFETEASPQGPAHHAAYREIDVFGVASVPEPAAWSLGMLAIGLASFRRRR